MVCEIVVELGDICLEKCNLVEWLFLISVFFCSNMEVIRNNSILIMFGIVIVVLFCSEDYSES